MVLDRMTANKVMDMEQISDRMMMVRIQAEPVNMVIVQIYMPTTDHDDEEVEKMYEQLEGVLDKMKGKENVVIMGDWNAVVGEDGEGREVGMFGLGKRNERGEKLTDFCRRNKFVVTNTLFQHHRRRRYTWKKPGDTGRYQIDYILVRQRYRNSVKNSRSYPGADADTDHNLVVMKINVMLKKIIKTSMKRKWDMKRLKTNEAAFSRSVEDSIQGKEGSSVESRWKDLKNWVLKIAKRHVGYQKGRRIKKPWVTEEMMTKMEERKKWKSRNNEEGRSKYRKINNELRRATDKAKEKWWEEECKELEELDRKGRVDLVYDRVRQLTSSNAQRRRGRGRRTKWRLDSERDFQPRGVRAIDSAVGKLFRSFG